MRFSQYGYQVREIKVRRMMVGEIKDTVLQSMVRNEAENDLVRLVNVTYGEVLEFDGMRALIAADLNNQYEVNFLTAQEIHFNDINRDVIVVAFEELPDGQI